MEKYNLIITIRVTVESDLHIHDLINELGSESAYDIPSTENVKVISSSWEDTNLA